MTLVAGVDSSTQSCKVEVRDADTGRCVGTGRAPHPPTSPPRSEQDPTAWWDALAAARAEAGHEDDVAAISVAAQQHGLVVTDAAGTPLRPAKLWNDTESAPDAGWLLGQLDGGAPAWADACGSVPVAAFTITKLSWLHRSEPDVFGRMERVMLPHDWLAWRITGEYGTDRGDASGTGYWSAAADDYRLDLLEIVDADLDWAALVPPVLPPERALGTGDNMAAALGLGLRAGDVVMSLGTSGTVFAVSDTPTHDASGAVAASPTRPGGTSRSCARSTRRRSPTRWRAGSAWTWRGSTRWRSPRLRVRVAPSCCRTSTASGRPTARTRPGSSPGCVPTRGVRTSRVAAYEGVVCGLLDGLDALVAAGVDTSDRLFLVGGGARSAAYPQVVADLARRSVLVVEAEELVALGACVQSAARATGRPIAEIQSAWPLGRGRSVDPVASADTSIETRVRYAAARDLDLD